MLDLGMTNGFPFSPTLNGFLYNQNQIVKGAFFSELFGCQMQPYV